MSKTTPLLIAVDYEDVRQRSPEGRRSPERVPLMTERLLSFFHELGARTTFFVVGDVVRRYPDLLRKVADAGHEIGWHTDEHLELSHYTPRTLSEDLRRGVDMLGAIVGQRPLGFRAPVMSMNSDTAWAYDVLAEAGFTYSSSVIPTRNPLNGWPGFGSHIRKMGTIWELPASVLPRTPLAFCSGIYMRALPEWLLRSAVVVLGKNRPLVGYVHPYDIDSEQERFRQDGTEASILYHWLMYYNRGSVLRKIRALSRTGYRLSTYSEYIQSMSAA